VLELARTALAAAAQGGDRRGEAMALVTIAFALREQGQYDEVVSVLDRSIALSGELGDQEAVAEGMRDLGAAQFQVGLMQEARATYATVREFARAAGDRAAEVAQTVNLAVVDSNLGRHDDALSQLHDALTHYEERGSVEGQAILMINIGWVHHLSEHDGDAVAALQEALRLSRTIGFLRGEAGALSWLAVTRRVLGDLDGAVASGLEAVEATREADLHGLECEALAGLGEAYLALDAHAEATAMFRAVEQVAREGSLAMESGRAWDGFAHVAARQGRFDRARRSWERAVSLYPQGVAAAKGARTHLAALVRGEPSGVECLRCRRGSAASAVVFGPWGDVHIG
jgi:tetratricopeptide (TPR) repeat protein